MHRRGHEMAAHSITYVLPSRREFVSCHHGVIVFTLLVFMIMYLDFFLNKCSTINEYDKIELIWYMKTCSKY